MNKLLLLILILLLVNHCSIKKKRFWNTDKSNIDEIANVKKILTKQAREEQELNPTLKIKISDGKFNKNFN